MNQRVWMCVCSGRCATGDRHDGRGDAPWNRTGGKREAAHNRSGGCELLFRNDSGWISVGRFGHLIVQRELMLVPLRNQLRFFTGGPFDGIPGADLDFF